MHLAGEIRHVGRREHGHLETAGIHRVRPFAGSGTMSMVRRAARAVKRPSYQRSSRAPASAPSAVAPRIAIPYRGVEERAVPDAMDRIERGRRAAARAPRPFRSAPGEGSRRGGAAVPRDEDRQRHQRDRGKAVKMGLAERRGAPAGAGRGVERGQDRPAEQDRDRAEQQRPVRWRGGRARRSAQPNPPTASRTGARFSSTRGVPSADARSGRGPSSSRQAAPTTKAAARAPVATSLDRALAAEIGPPSRQSGASVLIPACSSEPSDMPAPHGDGPAPVPHVEGTPRNGAGSQRRTFGAAAAICYRRRAAPPPPGPAEPGALPD